MIRPNYRFAGTNLFRKHTFAVPEDIFAGDEHVAERHEQDVRSPAIDSAITAWHEAKDHGDGEGLRTAGKALVDATSAAFRIQGVPTFAHPVLPPQFVKAETAGMAHLPPDQQKAAVAALLDNFDQSVKPSGLQQFLAGLRSSGQNLALEHSSHVRTSPEPFRPSRAIQEIEHASPPLGVAQSRQAVHTPRGPNVLEDSPPGNDATFQNAAFPLLGILGRERLAKAAKSAGYSIGADIVVTMLANARKPPHERKWPSWQSLLTSGLTGAASGFVELAPGEPWKWEAGIAVLGSLAEDALEGKDLRYWAAIGAGVGAGLWQKWGKENFKARFGDRPASQAVGKTVSKLIKEVFGAEVELASNELQEFMEGFLRAVENQGNDILDYWEKQFDDWLWQGDEDPFI